MCVVNSLYKISNGGTKATQVSVIVHMIVIVITKLLIFCNQLPVTNY